MHFFLPSLVTNERIRSNSKPFAYYAYFNITFFLNKLKSKIKQANEDDAKATIPYRNFINKQINRRFSGKGKNN